MDEEPICDFSARGAAGPERKQFYPQKSARLRVSRRACFYAVMFAQFGKNLGSLIEAVNRLGSLFYGSLLGVFTLAFFFPTGRRAWSLLRHDRRRVGHFVGVFLHRLRSSGYNVIGCVMVVGTGLLLGRTRRREALRK